MHRDTCALWRLARQPPNRRAAVVLSAPKGVTNALSLLCEQAAANEDFQPLFNKLNDTVTGIANNLNEELDGLHMQAW